MDPPLGKLDPPLRTNWIRLRCFNSYPLLRGPWPSSQKTMRYHTCLESVPFAAFSQSEECAMCYRSLMHCSLGPWAFGALGPLGPWEPEALGHLGPLGPCVPWTLGTPGPLEPLGAPDPWDPWNPWDHPWDLSLGLCAPGSPRPLGTLPWGLPQPLPSSPPLHNPSLPLSTTVTLSEPTLETFVNLGGGSEPAY